MTPPDRLARPCGLLLIDWLNERFGAAFKLSEQHGDVLVASDGDHRAGVNIAPLWEADAAWKEKLSSMEHRLAGAAEGSFLLWVPPRAEVPVEEPAASDFVDRVQRAAASLEPGSRTEVKVPRQVRMAKQREEGGYASVVGGLSRWWTRITEQVQGTYQVDSSAIHRLTHDGEARERLWETIGRLSHGVEVGQVVDFEVEEAWTLQRLPAAREGLAEGDPGFVIAGAPPAVDPTEGILVRRVARKRLQAANEALGDLDVDLRVIGLIGCYEYAELEGAGATVKALDPSLYTRFEAVCVLADGEVRPTFLPRALPWER